MNELIFKSKIWLTIKNPSVKNSYNISQSKSLNCWIITLCILGLVASLINLFVQLFYVKENMNPSDLTFPAILYVSYTTAALNTILSIIIIPLPSVKAKAILYYLHYFSLCIALFAINYSGSNHNTSPYSRYSLFGVEAFVKVVNIIGFFEFVDYFIMTVFNVVFIIPLYLILNGGRANGFFYTYLIFTFCFIIVSYLIVYLRKINFYFSEEHRIGKDRFKSIVDKMQSGFIHVIDYKICYINEMMKNIIIHDLKINKKKEPHAREENNKNAFTEENQSINDKFFEIEENSQEILEMLLKDLDEESDYRDINSLGSVTDNYCSSINNSNLPMNDCRQNHYVNIPSILSNKIPLLEKLKKQEKNSENKLKLIGTKTFRAISCVQEKTLEMHCRYHLNKETKQDEFEIFFNDITRVRQIEQKNSAKKYKSGLLSKVAHEFKNPLICILEIVIQLKENLRKIKEGKMELVINCEDNLNEINSFSNYLMILIKDFNYCSQKDSPMKKISFDREECELNDTLKFCNDIALSLLKRNGKDRSIAFQIEKSDDVPEKLITDEIRLKQVLINMISNSIKFTNQGKITLKINRENEDLQFRLSDTGVGIDTNELEKIFDRPYDLNHANELIENRSVLGMTLINDLTNALGKKIEITSQKNIGSDMFFSIPILGNIPIDSPDSNYYHIAENLNSTNLTVSSHAADGKEDAYTSDHSKSDLIKKHIVKSKDPHKINIKRKKSKEKSLFSKSKESNKEEVGKIFQNDFADTQLFYDDDFNRYYSNTDDSMLDISDKQDSSNNSIKKESLLFPNPIFLFPAAMSGNITMEKSPLSINKDRMKYAAKKVHIKNLDFTLNIDDHKEIKHEPKLKMESEIKIWDLHIKNTQMNQNKDDLNNNYPSKQLTNITILLSEFIDQFQFFEIINFNPEIGYLNILLVDDEKLTRSANRRLITVYAEKHNIKVNFFEAEDGFECLYILYVCVKKGVNISCVISDQTMNYLDGNVTAKIMKEMAHNEIFLRIPFYILTAYEDKDVVNKLRKSPVSDVFSKPMKKIFLEQILKEISR